MADARKQAFSALNAYKRGASIDQIKSEFGPQAANYAIKYGASWMKSKNAAIKAFQGGTSYEDIMAKYGKGIADIAKSSKKTETPSMSTIMKMK